MTTENQIAELEGVPVEALAEADAPEAEPTPPPKRARPPARGSELDAIAEMNRRLAVGASPLATGGVGGPCTADDQIRRLKTRLGSTLFSGARRVGL
jgi:hypothetical protein